MSKQRTFAESTLWAKNAPFYRATRMHSTDYAVARCLSVRPSVCHTPLLSLNGYTYPQKFFSPSGSPNILVFPHQTGWKYSDGKPPPPWGRRMQGGMKIKIFDQYHALSRVKHLLWKANRKPHPNFRMVPV